MEGGATKIKHVHQAWEWKQRGLDLWSPRFLWHISTEMPGSLLTYESEALGQSVNRRRRSGSGDLL